MGNRCDQCEENYFYNRSWPGCQECPACYRLVKDKVSCQQCMRSFTQQVLKGHFLRGKKVGNKTDTVPLLKDTRVPVGRQIIKIKEIVTEMGAGKNANRA